MAKLEGIERVQKHLDNINLDEKKLNQILSQACLIVENQARRDAPVDNGVLRNSIRSEVEGKQGVVGTNIEYAPYVEFGTGLFAVNGDGRQTPWSYQDEMGEWHTTIGQHPQPFLGPALEMNRETIINFIKERLENC